MIVYESITGKTLSLTKKLNCPSVKIEGQLVIDKPFILIVPTYGDGELLPSVIEFMNNKTNQSNIRGVVGTGNKNFGNRYALAADIISKNYKVPIVSRVELEGTREDIDTIERAVKQL